jgi:REP element-mobilizing transposase RayT
MTRYRRARIPGATYFFTVNLADRQSALLIERIDDLRAAIRHVRHHHPFRIDAMTVLPDHLHAVWTLPPDDATPSAGGSSRASSRAASRMANIDARVASPRRSGASGNDAIGNT